MKVRGYSPPGHPIQVVIRRTGLSADVLRAWEKRYQAVTPTRSASGRRLYSDDDVARLLLLRRALEAGRSIGQVAALPDPDLRDLVLADEAAARRSPPTAGRRSPVAITAVAAPDADPAAALLEAALDAVRRLDQPRLEAILDESAVVLARPVLAERLLVPLMHRIGEAWQDGQLRPVHEHVATVVVRSLISALGTGHPSSGLEPHLVAATPVGERHELGVLLAAATAVEVGWAVTYLGPDLPADDIAAAARELRARAVAVSIVHPSSDSRLLAEIERLRRALAPEILLLVGGRGTEGRREPLVRSGATVLSDLRELRRTLADASRQGPPLAAP